MIITVVSEGVLRIVAAQTGSLGGPSVLSNMAIDPWMPHAFADLSERLVTKNGVILMAAASASLMPYSNGRVSFLVVLYAINVLITFSLTQASMARMWGAQRREERHWLAKTVLHVVTLLLCIAILSSTTCEKFAAGGWPTFVITSGLIVVSILV